VELVLFTLRNALKHAHLVEFLMARRDAKKTDEEIAWLRSSANFERAAELSRALFPELGQNVCQQLLNTFGAADAPMTARIGLARKTARLLRGRRRYGPFTAGMWRGYRVAAMLMNRVSGRRDLVPESGGSIVALVGPKATGKSTLSAELTRRLGTYLDVVHIHAGKPPATALTFLPRLLIPVARRLFPGERPGEYEKQDRRSKRKYSLLYCLRMMMLAHDRYILLARALRLSAAGALVISDRYPSMATGAIDSSCFDDDALTSAGSRLKRWMMTRERALYARMPKPSFVLRLSAPMETAISRDASRNKVGGPDGAAVRRRWDMETGGVFGSRVLAVRTDRQLQETIDHIVRAAWAQI
jgi:hypothetical protein